MAPRDVKTTIRWGALLTVLATLLAMAGLLHFSPDQAAILSWLHGHKVMTLIGLAVIVGMVSFAAPERWAAKQEAQERIAREGLGPPAFAAVHDASKARGPDLAALRMVLEDAYGWRWRYRLPWLLLIGDPQALARCLPEAAEQGWQVTEDAVLLWYPKGHATATWLQQVYAWRRRRPVDAVLLVMDGDAATLPVPRSLLDLRRVLLSVTRLLRWSAPVYVLDVAGTDHVSEGSTVVIGGEWTPSADVAAVETVLLDLRDALGRQGVRRLGLNPRDNYTALLSQRLDTRASFLARLIGGLVAQRWPVRGAFFAPYPVNRYGGSQLPLWGHLGHRARRARGRHALTHPVAALAIGACMVMGLWIAGMLVSGVTNGYALHQIDDTVRTLRSPDVATRLHALLTLQSRIDQYEDRAQHGAPWYARFGLNRDDLIRAALWSHYATAVRPLLAAPLQHNLERRLARVSNEKLTGPVTQAMHARNYDALKAYLMLAEPARIEGKRSMDPPVLRALGRSDSLAYL